MRRLAALGLGACLALGSACSPDADGVGSGSEDSSATDGGSESESSGTTTSGDGDPGDGDPGDGDPGDGDPGDGDPGDGDGDPGDGDGDPGDGDGDSGDGDGDPGDPPYADCPNIEDYECSADYGEFCINDNLDNWRVCTSDCNDENDCPFLQGFSVQCIFVNAALQKRCYLNCENNMPCPQGMTCESENLGLDRICVFK